MSPAAGIPPVLIDFCILLPQAVSIQYPAKQKRPNAIRTNIPVFADPDLVGTAGKATSNIQHLTSNMHRPTLSTLTSMALFLTLALVSCRQDTPVESGPTESELRMLPPEQRYGELFRDVQMAKVFPDGKTFADCVPKYPTHEILEHYEEQKGQPDFNLAQFVEANFALPTAYSSGFRADPTRSVGEHIKALWPVLTRQPDQQDPGTLLPLPHPYIVPGGRFGEIYYWDSYFTMLGLQVSGRDDMIGNMIDNFAYLIDTVGFIPNGNRTYFLGRSQPPFFAQMVKLLAEDEGDSTLLKYLPALEKEYAFWMDGLQEVSASQPTHLHVVRLPDGSILNRYWDKFAKPRPEMYHDDVVTAEASGRPDEEVYQHIRAACESGWDFSSRWLADPQDLSTIRTGYIIPVDLNSLLFNLERTLAQAYRLAGDQENADLSEQRAAQRREALFRYCWSEEAGFFLDYDFEKGSHRPIMSLAGLYPLFFSLATEDQAASVAPVVRDTFLQAGGLVSTLEQTGQQWDAPNGWAPLQWIGIQGLRNYGYHDLADEIRQRWVNLNVLVYERTGKLVEKYNVMAGGGEAGGGEYPLQDGFGWTNGVLLKLLEE